MADQAEAQSDAVRRTGLWERWSRRERGACPIGLVFRGTSAPFPTWEYRPSYLAPGPAIEVAEGVPLEEPALFVLPEAGEAGRGPARALVQLPGQARLSATSRLAEGLGLVAYRAGDAFTLELRCLPGDRAPIDLRESLPLVLAPR